MLAASSALGAPARQIQRRAAPAAAAARRALLPLPAPRRRAPAVCRAADDEPAQPAADGPVIRQSFPPSLSSAPDAPPSQQAEAEQPQPLAQAPQPLLAQQADERAASSAGASSSAGSSSSSSSSALLYDSEDDEDGVAPLGSIDRTAIEAFLRPDPSELPDDLEMPIWDHLEELRERVLVAGLAAGVAIGGCFAYSKELVLFLEAPVADAGVRFLQLSPGEFFFTTFKVAGYSGLLLAAPTVLYEVIAYVVPGLTRSERRFLAPIVFGSSILFYVGLLFSYEILTPAALNFFVSYAEGAVESLWSIDQYFSFVLVLMLSTGLSFQVPIIQVMLGQLGLVSSTQMFSLWRYVVVGATVAAAVLTPSTDPFTQALLAIPLIGLYMGGAGVVRLLEQGKAAAATGAAN